jgi:hypothetical protein
MTGTFQIVASLDKATKPNLFSRCKIQSSTFAILSSLPGVLSLKSLKKVCHISIFRIASVSGFIPVNLKKQYTA